MDLRDKYQRKTQWKNPTRRFLELVEIRKNILINTCRSSLVIPILDFNIFFIFTLSSAGYCSWSWSWHSSAPAYHCDSLHFWLNKFFLHSITIQDLIYRFLHRKLKYPLLIRYWVSLIINGNDNYYNKYKLYLILDIKTSHRHQSCRLQSEVCETCGAT